MENGCILIVDDSPLILEGMSRFLSDRGYKTLTAKNGIEAIEKAFGEIPDLIILDVMMPKMNGYQTCRLLKSDPKTSHIPIIMHTTKDQISSKYWGIQTGADAYLSKESTQTALLDTIENLIKERFTVGDKKPSSMERSPISDIDVISKVNDLLDKRLFEATVINEIGSLIEKGVDDFKRTVDTVMETLSKVLEYNAAAIVISEDEHDIACFLKINHPIGERYLNRIKEYTRKYLKANDIYLDADAMTVFDADKVITPEGIGVEQKTAFFDVPIGHADKLRGLIILARDVSVRAEFIEEDFFRTSLKQAYVIIENSWLYNKVKRIAVTDSLTGIYNRGFLQESLGKEFARAGRFNLSLSFLMLDIDYFKKLNDTYGHQRGDSVLRQAAQIFKANTRDYDIVGRYGGEEFSIILQQTKLEDGIKVAERIRSSFEEYNFGDEEKPLKATISIGISSYPDADIKSVEELIGKSDKALYKAKKEGRNRVCF
ncbi:MAG: diguanylate cyclase [Nitrospinae bacterium]|nr:diguanylate cyclase [Nitrospinota bacterium]